MRTIKLIAVAMIVLIISASCHHNGSRIVVNNGIDRLNINYTGEIKFTEDETSIKSISPNGHLKYRKNNKKLEVKSGANGNFKLEMFDDGRKLNPEDNEGKQFLAEAIKEMISVGFDAKERMQRIYKKGGSRAILDEVGKVKNDFIKSMYLEFLLSQGNTPKGEITEIVDIIASQVNSDFEKGKLLNKFSADDLKDSLNSNAYFVAVKSIGSDFEKSNALKNILKQPLTVLQVDDALIVTTSIGSDFEKANVLKKILTQPLINKHFDKVLTVTNTLGSDFEKANVLKMLINNGLIEVESFSNLLSAINHIGSDFEKGNLLRLLIEKGFKSDEQWIAVIRQTAQVGSEFDRSNILIQIAMQMPRTEPVKTAYMEIAKSIQGEMEYGKVVKAIDK